MIFAKRSASRWLAVAALAAGLAHSVTAQTPPAAFDGAKWIWFSREPMPSSFSFPGGVTYFRGALGLPEKVEVRNAELIITADNLFSLWINGKVAGEGHPDQNLWSQAKRFDVTTLLAPGRNVIAVEAINTVPGPAGLLVKVVVQLADGSQAVFSTDARWMCSDREVTGWEQARFDDSGWRAPEVIGEFGVPPWGKFAAPPARERAGGPITESREHVRRFLEDAKEAARFGGYAGPRPALELQPPADYPWPEAIVFVGDDCSLYRPASHTASSHDSLTVTLFNPHHSSAFPEHDLPAPVKVGHTLYALTPARPGTTPRVLVDAGRGAIGSPSVSFDGRWIYFSMVREGEAFFHIYRVSADGDELQRLTDGPFHDIDPCELPDGRIVFTSTRIGTFEEYHNPPSRSLFSMSANGSSIRPITHTFIFDNEPEVLADGRILFIRSDNFFDRGKVETLLHAVHPDGTEGYTEFGLDLGPEYGSRLRAFNVGSPAPMPDGRVAFVTGGSIALGRPGCTAGEIQHLRFEAGDVAALPDGRLLCTLPRRGAVERTVRGQKQVAQTSYHGRIGLVDPQGRRDGAVMLFDSTNGPVHSVAFLGPRPRPPKLAQKVNPSNADDPRATGILFCQNARFTKNTTAGWQNVRAMRVLAGKGLTVRSSHSYIVHAGSEVTELGTVPLAPDGSFAVEVPADTAIAFQAVDAEGRSELNEMSWIYVRPGETRGCVGCHQPRQVTPPGDLAMMHAMRSKPLKLLGQGQPHRFRGNNAAVTGLMELQFDRYREIAGLNRHSEMSDARSTGSEEAPRSSHSSSPALDKRAAGVPPAGHHPDSAGETPAARSVEVAELIRHLKGADEGLRISAAQRLAIFRDPAAAPVLANCLRDASREVRVAAAMALATCGNRESIEPLLVALEDSDPLMVQAAVVALENITGHASVALGTAPASAWRGWLRSNRWDKIEYSLVQRLQSPDRDVVRRAAVALGHVGRDSARSALRGYVARERANNPYPEWRKQHQGDGAQFNARSPANPRTLQAATRALGYLRDRDAVPLLSETLLKHSDPGTGNLFLAEAAVEALGRIGTREAEAALTNAFARLPDYLHHTRWYGDHDALIACHAAPVHYLITEALDAMGSTNAAAIVPQLIRSVPTDMDRALFLQNDDCETLVGRVIRRAGAEPAVVETCLAILNDAQATRSSAIEKAIAATHQAWGGKPDPENRAAQILSLVCRDRSYEPRIRAAFDRYRARSNDIPRVFDTGIPVVTKLPVKHWVCFFLARSLGNLADPRSTEALRAALEQSPPEAALGHPDPLGPGVLFLHNDLTPCWRAATAWALGRIGDQRSAPVLLRIVRDLKNATDTRHAAAVALKGIVDDAMLEDVRGLAATYPEVSTQRVLQEMVGHAKRPRMSAVRNGPD